MAYYLEAKDYKQGEKYKSILAKYGYTDIGMADKMKAKHFLVYTNRNEMYYLMPGEKYFTLDVERLNAVCLTDFNLLKRENK